jgi:hypothetical protein
MFDPRTGRWLTEDPLLFEAGDPNLYRYVENSPTNAQDPSGLEWVVLGRVPGSTTADAGDMFKRVFYEQYAVTNEKPFIEYRQFRGAWIHGTWGQPGYGADGSGEFLPSGSLDLHDTTVQTPYGGARSLVLRNAPDRPDGYCNNTQDFKTIGTAGTLTAEFMYFKPGTYEVEILVEWKLMSGPSDPVLSKGRASVGAQGVLWLADETGNLRQESEEWATNARGSRLNIGAKIYKRTVKVGSDGHLVVAKWWPNVAGQIGVGKAIGEIWILDIQGPTEK